MKDPLSFLSLLIVTAFFMGKLALLGVVPVGILMILSYILGFELIHIFFLWSICSLLCIPVLLKIEESGENHY